MTRPRSKSTQNVKLGCCSSTISKSDGIIVPVGAAIFTPPYPESRIAAHPELATKSPCRQPPALSALQLSRLPPVASLLYFHLVLNGCVKYQPHTASGFPAQPENRSSA